MLASLEKEPTTSTLETGESTDQIQDPNLETILKMDLADDPLCRSDYYDLICPKIEPGVNGITPVAFIDSVDYISSVTDSNNNLGTANHIKSFLDEMLFADNGLSNGTGNGDLDGLTPNASGSFELLGSFQWSSNGIGIPGEATGSNADWLGPDGEVTTLTNLLDPLFVTYDQDDNQGSGNGNQNKIQYFADDGNGDSGAGASDNQNPIVSSDLISTTYIRENSAGTGNPEQTEQVWVKQENSPNSSFNFYDESLLRSALEAGKVIQTSNGTFGIGKACDMTELRKVLSFPPLLSSANSHSSTTPSPTSSSTPPGSSPPGTPRPNNAAINNTDAITTIVTTQPSGGAPFYEFKVLEPMYVSGGIGEAGDDANIPNVEELIMTRIHLDGVPTSTGSYRKSETMDMSASERKINSTTTLSTKWTYATPNSHGKPVKRRKKNNANNNGAGNGSQLKDSQISASILTITSCTTDSSENSISNSNSDNSRSPNSNLNGTRKERCLHYCNLCNKGFKDKYSVNVHVRTHTGEKPFGCTLCGKNFRQKAHLAKHHQTHAAKANGHTGKGNGKR